MKYLNRREKHAIAVSLGVAALLLFLFFFGFFSQAQFKLQDALVGTTPDPRITLVAIDDSSIQEIGRWPWSRDIYAQVLPRLKDAKAIGIDVVFSERADAAGDSALAFALNATPRVVLSAEYTDFTQTNGVSKGNTQLLPLPELRAAAQVGMVNMITDRDGIVRTANTQLGEKLLSEKTAEIAFATLAPKQDRLLFDLSPPNSYPRISFADLLFNRTAPNLSHSIVLIGATANDLHDSHNTPVGQMAGVELQANLLAAILDNRFFSAEPTTFAIVAIIFASLIVGFLISRSGAWVAAAVTLGLLIAYYLVAVFASNHHILLELVFTPLAFATSFVANLTHTLLFERREKKYIHDAFSRYVAPEVVRVLMKNPDLLKLGGDRREITIFFSDVRGFTTLSEALSPEQLVSLLNEYLSAMTDLIMDGGGVVDKYIGDAIMAFWGAPLDQPDHAIKAAKCALAQIAKLKELQKKWAAEGVPPLEIGVGLNTGPAVIGNMGSHQRFNYTCMGDTINLGSRLEGITKEYGVRLIIAQSTREQLGPEFIVRELDLVRVKGKNEPIRIFELVATADTLSDKQKHIITHWEAGLAKYRAKEFKRAIEDFTKAAHEGDKTSKIYIERCEHFIKEHPGKDWDCVWVMKTK